MTEAITHNGQAFDFDPVTEQLWAAFVGNGPTEDDILRGSWEYEQRMAKVSLEALVRRDYAAREASAAWEPPPFPGSAAEQLANGIPQVKYIIDGLWAEGGINQINAQKKSGKTTLMLNLATSLLTGGAFLNRFPVNCVGNERVAYLNTELPAEMFMQWVAETGMEPEQRERLHPYHARENRQIPFHSDAAVNWLLAWLDDCSATYLIIDALSDVYSHSGFGGGSDPNVPYLKFWAVLQDVQRIAKLRGIKIAHHTGVSEDGGNRARGASAMMDKPDVNMTYRYNVAQGGSFTDRPTDNLRYLSAFGRGVDAVSYTHLTLPTKRIV